MNRVEISPSPVVSVDLTETTVPRVVISTSPAMPVDLELELFLVNVGAASPRATATGLARPPVVTAIRSATVTAVVATASATGRVASVIGSNAVLLNAVRAQATASALVPALAVNATVTVPLATAIAIAPAPLNPLTANVVAAKADSTTNAPVPIIIGEVILTGGGPGTTTAMAGIPTVTGIASTILTSESFSGVNGAINATALDLAFGGSAKTWVAVATLVRDTTKLAANSTTGFKIARVDVGSPDGYSEIFYDTLHTGSIFVLGRLLDGGNFYQVECRSDGVLIIYVTTTAGGDGPPLWTSAAAVGGVGKRIGIGCVGTSISAYVNGVLLQTVTDGSLTTGNSWGCAFGSGFVNGRLDNFKVANGPLP